MEDPPLVDFLSRFGGLTRCMPVSGGSVIYGDLEFFGHDPWAENIDEDDYEDDDYQLWMDALIFFDSETADKLLLRDDGVSGWFFHAEHRIEPYGKTTDEMLANVLEYFKAHNGPFDAYSAF